MSVLRTVTTSWALRLEWGRLECINYFGNKTSYSAERHMKNKRMEDNIKMHSSDIGITGVQPSDSARDSYDFLS
jgi:hypothetical protein